MSFKMRTFGDQILLLIVFLSVIKLSFHDLAFVVMNLIFLIRIFVPICHPTHLLCMCLDIPELSFPEQILMHHLKRIISLHLAKWCGKLLRVFIWLILKSGRIRRCQCKLLLLWCQWVDTREPTEWVVVGQVPRSFHSGICLGNYIGSILGEALVLDLRGGDAHFWDLIRLGARIFSHMEQLRVFNGQRGHQVGAILGRTFMQLCWWLFLDLLI